jgi:hypothetical protein
MTASIYTKYIGPTNFRGSRIKATASNGAGSLTVSYDHALNVDGNHAAAARALAKKLGWHGRVSSGGAPGGRGNVYVYHGEDYEFSRHRRRRYARAPRRRRRRR